MWICHKCNLHNFGGNKVCANFRCNSPRQGDNPISELEQILHNRILRRMADKSPTNEELHAQFFNKGAIIVKDMTDNEIRAWQDEMSLIALEARAKYSAGDNELRSRAAKNGKGNEWLVSNEQNDPNVTNAIRVVKSRAERTNKADKLKATMLALGVENVDDLMKNVVMPDKSVTKPYGPKYNFNGIQTPVDDVPDKLKDKQEEIKSETKEEKKEEPFNPFKSLLG